MRSQEAELGKKSIKGKCRVAIFDVKDSVEGSMENLNQWDHWPGKEIFNPVKLHYLIGG